ncbi:MAG: hypothetical protein C0501_30015 [Isosphaera sp.]|nr:hypothetical protein [Isosphaera sp.]
MRHLVAAVVFAWAAGPSAADDYPHVYLTNDKLKVKVYLPDAEKGFYRGTRFDHAGVFGEVEFAGHKLFGPWKEKHDPTNHDDIIGPAEEFGMQEPLGYSEAKVGGTFLKIGVGELEKPKEEKYHFANRYKVVKPAAWKRVDAINNGVIWEAEQKANGFGYRYVKIVFVTGASLTVVHGVRNTGDKPITTDFYNHNFFNVDGDGVGPNYSIAFPFEVGAKDQKGKFGDLVELKGKELRFKDKLTDGFVMAGMTGFDPKRDDRGFNLRHGPSRITVGVRTGYPLAKLNVWGVKTTICPEPFLLIENLKPGEWREWMTSYEFTRNPLKK